jgi:hypothetical protein
MKKIHWILLCIATALVGAFISFKVVKTKAIQAGAKGGIFQG